MFLLIKQIIFIYIFFRNANIFSAHIYHLSLIIMADRSWAKRARGQPRRGDLLNADFSGDRERPNSPSPLVETKPFLQEEEAKPTGYVLENNPLRANHNCNYIFIPLLDNLKIFIQLQ